MKRNHYVDWLSSLIDGVASDILQMRGNLYTVSRIAVIVLFLAASVVTFDSCSKSDIDDPELIEKPDTDGDEDGDNTGDEEDDPSGDEDGDNTGDKEDDPSDDEDGDNTGDKEDDTTGYYEKDYITYYYNETEAIVYEADAWNNKSHRFVIQPSIETKSGRTIPVTRIGDRAFSVASCAYITSIEIPRSITSVGEGAFYVCERLKSIELPMVTSIGQNAFRDCKSLRSISLPLVTSIGENTFSGCEDLESIELPLVTSIGENAFNGCASLTSVSFPAATSVGGYAFKDCKRLTSVELPEANLLGEYVFYN